MKTANTDSAQFGSSETKRLLGWHLMGPLGQSNAVPSDAAVVVDMLQAAQLQQAKKEAVTSFWSAVQAS